MDPIKQNQWIEHQIANGHEYIAKAEDAFEKSEDELENIEARLHIEYSKKIDDAKVTQIRAHVRSDERYVSAKDKVRIAKVEYKKAVNRYLSAKRLSGFRREY